MGEPVIFLSDRSPLFNEGCTCLFRLHIFYFVIDIFSVICFLTFFTFSLSRFFKERKKGRGGVMERSLEGISFLLFNLFILYILPSIL